MDYLQNHIWCSDSNWGCHYDCRHLVSISSFKEDGDDWNNIVDKKAESFVDEEHKSMIVDILKKDGKEARVRDEDFIRYVPNLKPHVLQWLKDNVEDRKDPDCEKGWCIGSTQYRYTDKTSITVFFHRKNDAMAFIKKFSKYKKPVNYCQYFTDVRKKLNLDTLKYEER